jgi:hypothetical protein
MWPDPGGVSIQQPHLRPQAMLADALPYSPPPQARSPYMPPLTPLPIHHGQQQAPMPPTSVAWSSWMGSWDQQSLANSLITMTMVPPAVTDWVADSGASNHTNSDAGNLTSVRPSHINDSSSIIVGNIFSLSVTSVCDTTLLGLFYLNNVLVTPDIIQNLLSVRCCTTDNWCFMKFDPFGLSVNDLSTRNVIVKDTESPTCRTAATQLVAIGRLLR